MSCYRMLSRYRAANDVRDDEPGEKLGYCLNHRPGGYAAQAGKLLDYSAHAWESFTAITLAYVLINAVIMLVMSLVERKVRLPGNVGSK